MDARITRRTLFGGTIAVAGLALASRTSAQSSAWTLLDDGSGPLARWDHALLADAESGRLYLFGGRDANGATLGDLWSFDLAGGGWSVVDTPGPSARFGPAAAVIPGGSGFYLFGGETAAEFFNDLWSFDFASQAWTLLDDGTDAAPSPRYGLGGDFDANERFVVSHGFTFEGRFNDTWAYDSTGNSWLDVSPPAETRPLQRCLHEVTAVQDRSTLLLYAGCSSGYGPCPQGDLWSFDVAADSWVQLFPDVAPAPRSSPAVTAQEGGILLVGGLTDAGPTSDVWQGAITDQGFVWTERSESSNVIPPRSSHDMTAIGTDTFVFGGMGINGAMADLWRHTAQE